MIVSRLWRNVRRLVVLISVGYPNKGFKVARGTGPTREIIGLDFIENLEHGLRPYLNIGVGVVLCDA